MALKGRWKIIEQIACISKIVVYEEQKTKKRRKWKRSREVGYKQEAVGREYAIVRTIGIFLLFTKDVYNEHLFVVLTSSIEVCGPIDDVFTKS